MKPCSKNRKLLAWLALDSLAAPQAKNLRAHLETCPGCRGYFAEVSNVTRKLAGADPAPEITASNSFHQKLAGRIRAEASASIWETFAANLRGSFLNWLVVLPAATVAAAVIVALSVLQRHSSAPVPIHVQAALPRERSDPSPTFANYTMVANQSLDKLDDLLNRQGNRNPPPTHIYRASNVSD